MAARWPRARARALGGKGKGGKRGGKRGWPGEPPPPRTSSRDVGAAVARGTAALSSPPPTLYDPGRRKAQVVVAPTSRGTGADDGFLAQTAAAEAARYLGQLATPDEGPVAQGFGVKDDLDVCEEFGAIEGADPDVISGIESTDPQMPEQKHIRSPETNSALPPTNAEQPVQFFEAPDFFGPCPRTP